MGDQTGIEWADATWNVLRGCTRVSPGCGGPGPHGGCYAEAIAARFSGPGQPFEGLAEMRGGKPRWTGKVAFAEHLLILPLRWRRPRRIFVNSMSDLFHEDVPDAWIDRVFAVMALAPQHTFQCLTKRSARMRAYCSDPGAPGRIARKCVDLWISKVVDAAALDPLGKWPVEAIGDPDEPDDLTLRTWPLPNVWLGISSEDQRRADERVPDLLATPAAVRFVSAEPLLSGINFRSLPPTQSFVDKPLLRLDGLTGRHHCGPAIFGDDDMPRLDWIIVGGESGPNARPMHPHWARDIRDQCAAAGVAFHFKQHGAWAPVDLDGAGVRDWMIVDRTGGVDVPDDRLPDEAAGEIAMRLVGKARAGRLLDGVEHNAMPEVRA